ncbi:hypothetical protein Barb7_02686 [Bacteroidales bacterium Barb7]|nr:hypothetical protein Barb7_02686 [Bacteroidales bacterium Barb7]
MVAGVSALVEQTLYIETLREVKLNVTDAVEVVVGTSVVVFNLILHRIAHVETAHTREISTTVFFIYRIYGGKVIGMNIVIPKRELHVNDCTRSGQTDTQAVVDGTLLELETEVMAFQFVVAGDTLAIHVRIRSAVVALRSSSRQGKGVVLGDTCAKHFTEPIGVGIVYFVGSDVISQICVGLTPFGGIHHVGLVGNMVGCYIAAVIYLRLCSGTSFSGNQNNTAGSTRTVDGGGRSILQYGNAFNITGRHGGHVTARNTVNNNHRALVVLQRGHPAQMHLTAARYIARAGGYHQTGNLALQQVGDITGRPFVEVLSRHIGYRTRD